MTESSTAESTLGLAELLESIEHARTQSERLHRDHLGGLDACREALLERAANDTPSTEDLVALYQRHLTAGPPRAEAPTLTEEDCIYLDRIRVARARIHGPDLFRGLQEILTLTLASAAAAYGERAQRHDAADTRRVDDRERRHRAWKSASGRCATQTTACAPANCAPGTTAPPRCKRART